MKKFENFQRALRNLEEIKKYKEPYEIIELTGQVALFEICFEQSWKAMKEILEYNGYDESRTGSPRSILKLAYQSGMIEDEELWAKGADTAINRKWWDYMADIMETNPDNSPVCEDLKNVFHLD